MPALRMTPPSAPPLRRFLRGAGAVAAALGVLGCAAPPPTHTLRGSDLPGTDRWMVRFPGERHGKAVGPRVRLPDGADTAQVLVYYARPGSRPSIPLTVAEIAAGRAAHTSLALLR